MIMTVMYFQGIQYLRFVLGETLAERRVYSVHLPDDLCAL